MQNDKRSYDEIEYALEKLDRISNNLRSYSLMLVTVTLANLVFTMLLMSGMYRAFKSESFGLTISLFPIILAIFVVLIAFRFDVLRKDGDAYFEELSDEMHGKKISEENESYKNSISLKARVIIRSYSNAASLPLVPGRYGPAILAATNIIFSFLAALIGTRFY